MVGSARLTSWLPSGRATRQLLAVSSVDSVGTGLFLAGSALFFTRVLGLTIGQVGVGLSLAAGAGLLCSVPIGRLSDRIGPKRTLTAMQAFRAVCFSAYPFATDFPRFLVIAALLGICEHSVGPVVQSAFGAVEEGQSRVRSMAALSIVRNAGFTIGALLAILAIAVDDPTVYRGLVLVTAASFAISALALLRMPPWAVTRSEPDAGWVSLRLHDRRYLALSLTNGTLWLHTVLLTVGIPLWLATRTSASTVLVGVTVVVNTLLAMTLPIRMSRGSDDVVVAAVRHRRSGIALAACCVLIAISGSVGSLVAIPVVVLAAVALTMGEIWQGVGAWGLSYGLSPVDQRGTYLAVYYLGGAAMTIVGPALLTLVIIPTGAYGWLLLGCVFAAVGLVSPIIAPASGPSTGQAPITNRRGAVR